MTITFEWRGEFTNDEVNALHAEAFETRVFTDAEWDWRALTSTHSLGWVTAREGTALVGFVNVVWDGLVHAWLQDTMVARSARGRGVGTGVVAAARRAASDAGCEWLHVDFDADLHAFYIDACGFRPTSAGLIALQGDDDPDVTRPAVAGRTERLILEPLDLVHARGLFDALDDERVGTFIGGPDVTTVEALRDRIIAKRQGPGDDRDETWLNWVVIAGETIVGRVEATLHDGLGEVAYVFGPGWWGNGYATEATRWMIEHLQAERDVSECWATVAPGNDASARLLERLGFEHAAPGIVELQSYDDGDLVFRRRL